MSRIIVRILRLDPPYYDVPNTPERTLHIDATTAQNLGMTELVNNGELRNLNFKVGSKVEKMDAILLSLEYPTGNIIRLTKNALTKFHLQNNAYYWARWSSEMNTLTILRKVTGK